MALSLIINTLKRTGLALSALLLFASGGLFNATLASATPKGDDNVTICHRDDSVNKPYGPKPITVDPASVSTDGHGGHTGPVAYTTAVAQSLKDAHTFWGDIIPPTPGYLPNGLNWDASGQAVYNNGCQPLDVATVTPPTASTPTCDNPNMTIALTNTTGVSWAPTDMSGLVLAPGQSGTYVATVASGYTVPTGTQLSYTFTNNFDPKSCEQPTPADITVTLECNENDQAVLTVSNSGDLGTSLYVNGEVVRVAGHQVYTQNIADNQSVSVTQGETVIFSSEGLDCQPATPPHFVYDLTCQEDGTALLTITNDGETTGRVNLNGEWLSVTGGQTVTRTFQNDDDIYLYYGEETLVDTTVDCPQPAPPAVLNYTLACQSDGSLVVTLTNSGGQTGTATVNGQDIRVDAGKSVSQTLANNSLITVTINGQVMFNQQVTCGGRGADVPTPPVLNIITAAANTTPTSSAPTSAQLPYTAGSHLALISVIATAFVSAFALLALFQPQTRKQ